MDKIIINGQECDCYANNQIAIQYNSSIFGEVGDLLSGFTYTIHLPITANNERIIELSNIVTAVTKFPYKAHKAIIERDGVQIVSGDLYILSVADDIECSIAFGVKQGLVKLLDSETTLKDVCRGLGGKKLWYNMNELMFVENYDYLDVDTVTENFPRANYGLDHYEDRAGCQPVLKVTEAFDMAKANFGINIIYDENSVANLCVPLMQRKLETEYEFNPEWPCTDLGPSGGYTHGDNPRETRFITTDDNKYGYVKLAMHLIEGSDIDSVVNSQPFVHFTTQTETWINPIKHVPYSNLFFPITRGVTITPKGTVKLVVRTEHISYAQNVEFTISSLDEYWKEKDGSAGIYETFARTTDILSKKPSYVRKYDGYLYYPETLPGSGDFFELTYVFDDDDESDEMCGIKNPFPSYMLDSKGYPNPNFTDKCYFHFFGVKYDKTYVSPTFAIFIQGMSDMIWDDDFSLMFKKKHCFLDMDGMFGHYPADDYGEDFKGMSFDGIPEGNYDRVANIPEIKFNEFFKAVLAITGLNAVLVDNHTIKLNGLSGSFDKSKAVDYSANLLNSNSICAKKVGFGLKELGKKNKYKYSDGFSKSGEWDATIEVDGDSLEDEKTAIELPFHKYYTYTVAQLPIYSYEDEPIDGAVDPTTDEMWVRHHLQLDESDDIYIAEIKHDEKLGYYLTGESLHWNNILDEHYDGYRDALKNAKVITEDFLFSPIELKQIDLTVPIYLDKYNSYFLINKLTTKENNVCEAELIKI